MRSLRELISPSRQLHLIRCRKLLLFGNGDGESLAHAPMAPQLVARRTLLTPPTVTIYDSISVHLFVFFTWPPNNRQQCSRSGGGVCARERDDIGVSHSVKKWMPYFSAFVYRVSDRRKGEITRQRKLCDIDVVSGQRQSSSWLTLAIAEFVGHCVVLSVSKMEIHGLKVMPLQSAASHDKYEQHYSNWWWFRWWWSWWWWKRKIVMINNWWWLFAVPLCQCRITSFMCVAGGLTHRKVENDERTNKKWYTLARRQTSTYVKRTRYYNYDSIGCHSTAEITRLKVTLWQPKIFSSSAIASKQNEWNLLSFFFFLEFVQLIRIKNRWSRNEASCDVGNHNGLRVHPDGAAIDLITPIFGPVLFRCQIRWLNVHFHHGQ